MGTFSNNTTQDITSLVTWASATPAVATINAAGVATGVTVGTSSISATMNGVTGSTVLTVTPAPTLTSIMVMPASRASTWARRSNSWPWARSPTVRSRTSPDR